VSRAASKTAGAHESARREQEHVRALVSLMAAFQRQEYVSETRAATDRKYRFGAEIV